MKSFGKVLAFAASIAATNCASKEKPPEIPVVVSGVHDSREMEVPQVPQREFTPEEIAILKLQNQRSLFNLRMCLINKDIDKAQCESLIEEARQCTTDGELKLYEKYRHESPDCEIVSQFHKNPEMIEKDEGIYVTHDLKCRSHIEERHGTEVETMQRECRQKAHRCLAEKIVRENIPCEEKDFYMEPQWIRIED